MKKGQLALTIVVAVILAVVVGERLYVSKMEQKFVELEKQRIVTSNKLATAKIVSENLNHVRDLVFKNMDFHSQKYTARIAEDNLFTFLTTCVNDLKLKLVALRPRPMTVNGRITTYPYEMEIEGDFFKFGELCAKFENSRRIISLETFEVELAAREEVKGGPVVQLIKVRMLVNTYWIRKD